jgi:fibronectin-binding autotransporter adhesin
MTSTIKTPLFFIVLSLACAAQQSGAQSTWGGGGLPSNNLNWSDAANWSAGGVPGSSSTVTFPDGAYPITTNTAGNVNNIVPSSITISSLTYNNLSSSGDYDTTEIPSGQTLTISGSLSLGGSDGASQNTSVTMTGGGSLIVGTSGSPTLSGQNGSAQGSASVLNLSGLNAFSFGSGTGSSATVNFGTGGSGSAIVVTLASTSNNIVCGTFNLGNNNTRGGGNTVNLGNGTNIIDADTINMGIAKTSATMQFFNNAGGGLLMASHTGTGRATINLGTENGNAGSTSTESTGNMLFNGGMVNILAGTLTLANRSTRADSPGALGVLSFNSGLVDATAITMSISAAGGGSPFGDLSVGGPGVLKIGTGGLSMVNETGATAGAGTLIVTNGGTVICSNNIFKVTSMGVATISVSGSALTMASESGTIGVANSLAIDDFNVTNSTLTLPAIGVGQPDVATINFNPDTTTTNTINISSLPVISSFPTQIPMITYTTAGGNLASETSGMTNIVLGTLPSPFMGYLSNNLANSSIDLVLTNGPLPKADTWTGAINDIWDITTFNWTSSGIATNYNDLDQVTFNDSCVTNVVNLTGTRTPSASNGLTFDNNITNYTLIGVGKISGPVQLLQEGSAKTTLSESGGDNFSGGIEVSSGTLVLDDANSAISGGLTISGSTTVQIGNNDSNGTLPSGTLDDEGTLVYDHANNITVSVAIPGGGALVQNDTNTLTLSATNTYTGPTTVNAGTLALTGLGAISSSSGVNVSNATLDVSGVTANANVTTLQNLNLTNATLNVEVSYIQTNLNITSALNLGGPTNVINVKSLPAIAHYPATLTLLNTASGITGYNLLGLGTLPTATPAYAGSLSEVGNTVVLTLSSGPTNSRPSVTWSGVDALNTGITNWSDALNWQTPGVPTATEPVTFNNTDPAGGSVFNPGQGATGIVTPANVNNYVNISLTNSALTYGNAGNYQNTEIGSGKTLTINGSLTVNGSGGNVTILGAGGTLQINNPNNNNTFNLEAASAPILDMSGLDTFNATIGQIGVGFDIASQSTLVSGVWYLAKTNVITTGSGFLGGGAAWVIGGSETQNGAGNGVVYLGQTNAIYVDGIVLGVSSSTNSVLTFNPNLINPVAYIRGITGPSSRVTMWSLGDDTVNLNNNNDGYGQTNDFTSGTLNALVSTLIIGQGNQGNAALTPGDIIGTFNMGAGNLNVTTLNIGVADSGKTGGAGVGVMNVTGGTVEAANALGLGVGTVSGTAATLDLTNATLVDPNGVTTTAGTLSILTETNSIIEFGNGTIGSSSAPITNLNLGGGTLQFNVNGASGQASVFATAISTNGSLTTIQISSLTGVAAGNMYPLISYTGTDPYANLSLAPLPAGYVGTLVDNSNSDLVELEITSVSVGQPVITGFSIKGNTLTLSATNGQDNAMYSVYGTTNLNRPVTWTLVFTNSFDGNGDINGFSTNVVNPQTPDEFYLIEEP